ncbi:MAG: PilN domain-containing protein, partial [Bryobacteraceae bacterium]
ESDVIASWARLRKTGGKKSSDILVAITRREVIDRLQTLFAEGGVKVAAFSFSASALYSSIRLFSNPPPEGFLSAIRKEDSLSGDTVEAYGESPARAILSTEFEHGAERARDQALSELRLEPSSEVLPVSRFLPPPVSAAIDFDLSRTALPYAAALAGACPRLALPLNLLPVEQRSQTSRARYIPSIALAALLVLALLAWWGETVYARRDYEKKLRAEIARLEPQARLLAKLEKDIEATRARTVLLDKMRRRTKADIDVLAELTKILAPPAWVASMDLSRTSVVLAGEAGQSATLLKLLDDSPLFRGAEFLIPPARGQGGEVFRIRVQREGVEQ